MATSTKLQKKLRRDAPRFNLKDLFAVSAGNLLVEFGCAAAPTFLPALIDRAQEESESGSRECLAYNGNCA